MGMSLAQRLDFVGANVIIQSRGSIAPVIGDTHEAGLMCCPRWRCPITYFVDRDRFGNLDRFHTDQHLVERSRSEKAWSL